VVLVAKKERKYMSYEIVTKEAFQAIGLKWEGTFAEAGAGAIKEIIHQVHGRLKEIDKQVNPDILLGLSNHADPKSDRFTHYSVVEVEAGTKVPEGLIQFSLPTLKYVKTYHPKGESVQDSYTKIYNWIKENGYTLAQADITHFEEYPMKQDAFESDPEFGIMIPIK
jgi:predicted transcriptional regulator YdeE